MQMCCDIFAVERLWRGCLLTTGHLSSSHPVVVGAGDVLWGLYGGGAEAWAYSGSCDAERVLFIGTQFSNLYTTVDTAKMSPHIRISPEPVL